MRFEIRYFFLEIEVSPSLHTFAFHGLACATIQCVCYYIACVHAWLHMCLLWNSFVGFWRGACNIIVLSDFEGWRVRGESKNPLLGKSPNDLIWNIEHAYLAERHVLTFLLVNLMSRDQGVQWSTVFYQPIVALLFIFYIRTDFITRHKNYMNRSGEWISTWCTDFGDAPLSFDKPLVKVQISWTDKKRRERN